MVRQSTSASTGQPEWFFFDGGPGSPRYGDDPTKHAVEHDTETFVREVLQNANDQRLDDERPVSVRFEFRELTGSDRDSFLSSLNWESELRRRLEAVTGDDRGLNYDRFLKQITSGVPLRLLAVHDRNTTGLTGSWEEDSNYAALVRDELYSSKQDQTAGGSYGLGKSVLWTFSAASTVLFYSTPGHDVPTVDRPFEPRLIGRTKLPTHRLDSEGPSYQGAGWLCDQEETDAGVRPQAVEGTQAQELSEMFYLGRPPGRGTTMLVVGFADPTAEERRETETLGEQFRRAAVKYFWPAINQGDLEVTVDTPDSTLEANVDSVPAVQPFVECYQAEETSQTLSVPGDVASINIPVNPPPLADGTETPAGSVRLATKLATPTDTDDLRNRVALFRGAGMVVKYLNQSRIAYSDRNFFAVLAAGEARCDNSDMSDDEIDRFLRAAEPPDHDDWRSTENLRNRYRRGYRQTLDGIYDDLREALRYSVARTDRRGEELSERVRGQFPIHGGLSHGGGSPQPDAAFKMSGDANFINGRWRLETVIEPTVDEFTEWSATVSLAGVGEDGNTQDDVPLEDVTVERGEARVKIRGGTATVVSESSNPVELTGASTAVSDKITGGGVGETRLSVEAKVNTGGEES